MTVGDIEYLLSSSSLKGFPVVVSEDSQYLVGWITRRDLTRALGKVFLLSAETRNRCACGQLPKCHITHVTDPSQHTRQLLRCLVRPRRAPRVEIKKRLKLHDSLRNSRGFTGNKAKNGLIIVLRRCFYRNRNWPVTLMSIYKFEFTLDEIDKQRLCLLVFPSICGRL